MQAALEPIAMALALAGGLIGSASGERPANSAGTTWARQTNRDVSQLVINTQGGPGEPDAANRCSIDGSLNTTSDIKVNVWCCPSTGCIHVVHRNLNSKIAARAFPGNMSDELIGKPLHRAGTMTVLAFAFDDLGEYSFSAVRQ